MSCVLGLQHHSFWNPLEMHLFRCHPGLLSQKLCAAAKRRVLRSPLLTSQTRAPLVGSSDFPTVRVPTEQNILPRGPHPQSLILLATVWEPRLSPSPEHSPVRPLLSLDFPALCIPILLLLNPPLGFAFSLSLFFFFHLITENELG